MSDTNPTSVAQTSALRVAAPATHETAASAAAAQVKALVEARYMVALARPRDMDSVRTSLLKECHRPSFAEVARYRKPQGKKLNERTGKWEENFAIGPSVRFAEAAIRCMTNIVIEQNTTYDDDDKRLIQVSVSDLEANASYTDSITVMKSLERKKPRDGDQILSQRTNSKGKVVFLVRATDDEIQNKKNALLSKSIRTMALRFVPGDIIDECMEEVLKTQNNKDAADPDAARRKIIDGFALQYVSVAELKKYCGGDLDKLSPAELAELRALYSAIKDGETTWRAAMEEKFPDQADARFQSDAKSKGDSKAPA